MAVTSNKMSRPKEVAFYRQRLKNRIFTVIVKFFADEAARRGVTKKDIALYLDRDPAQITRWLSAPSNMTLDTISDLLLALEAEPGRLPIERLEDKVKPNYAHPLMGELLGASQTAAAAPAPKKAKVVSSNSTSGVANFEPPKAPKGMLPEAQVH